MVESAIDSLAKGIIQITKITPDSEIFIHQCQYYLDMLEKHESTQCQAGFDKIIDFITMLMLDGRIQGWLVGKIQPIDFNEPMYYCINKNLLLCHRKPTICGGSHE